MHSAKTRTLAKRAAGCIDGRVKFLRMTGVIVLVLLAAGGAAWLLRDELLARVLPGRLASELSQLLGAEVEIGDAGYRDGTLRVGRGVVTGEAMPFERLEFEDARTALDWRQWREWTKSPLHIEAAKLDLVWRDGAAGSGAKIPRVSAADSLPPLDILAARFSFRRADAAGWQLRDTAARLRRENGAWSVSARDGFFEAPGWPAMKIERLSIEQQGRDWRVPSFALADEQGGVLAGSAVMEDGKVTGEFSWQDLQVSGFLPEEAASYFSARSSGDARLEEGELRGSMKLAGAETRHLPALVKLASVFRRENYDTVPWESVRFEFLRGPDGTVTFANLLAVSPAGLAVRGSGTVSARTLSADLQLGVRREGRPWLVAFVPVLFRNEKDGYLWTAVKVGGTPQKPTEDLSPRIVAAIAALPAAEAVEAATEIPAGAVEAAGGLLRELLGR